MDRRCRGGSSQVLAGLAWGLITVGIADIATIGASFQVGVARTVYDTKLIETAYDEKPTSIDELAAELLPAPGVVQDLVKGRLGEAAAKQAVTDFETEAAAAQAAEDSTADASQTAADTQADAGKIAADMQAAAAKEAAKIQDDAGKLAADMQAAAAKEAAKIQDEAANAAADADAKEAADIQIAAAKPPATYRLPPPKRPAKYRPTPPKPPPTYRLPPSKPPPTYWRKPSGTPPLLRLPRTTVPRSPPQAPRSRGLDRGSQQPPLDACALAAIAALAEDLQVALCVRAAARVRDDVVELELLAAAALDASASVALPDRGTHLLQDWRATRASGAW